MRHKAKSKRLGRKTAHARAMIAALVRALIKEQRIRTTLPKARLARRASEKMVTVARRGTLAARRQVVAAISDGPHVKALFDTIVPMCKSRSGGYTRIVKLGRRASDSSEMAILEWVGVAPQGAANDGEKPADSKT
jgi:large subunit ribosomal protein L17